MSTESFDPSAADAGSSGQPFKTSGAAGSGGGPTMDSRVGILEHSTQTINTSVAEVRDWIIKGGISAFILLATMIIGAFLLLSNKIESTVGSAETASKETSLLILKEVDGIRNHSTAIDERLRETEIKLSGVEATLNSYMPVKKK